MVRRLLCLLQRVVRHGHAATLGQRALRRLELRQRDGQREVVVGGVGEGGGGGGGAVHDAAAPAPRRHRYKHLLPVAATAEHEELGRGRVESSVRPELHLELVLVLQQLLLVEKQLVLLVLLQLQPQQVLVVLLQLVQVQRRRGVKEQAVGKHARRGGCGRDTHSVTTTVTLATAAAAVP